MSTQTGLRERKKEQTRELIATTARRLFSERGFEGVTVAEIARAADVAEKTVFNYFPTKEDLFYSRLEAFEEELLEAVRGRARGESVIAAFRTFITRQRGVFDLSDDEASEQLRTITRVITGSPALLAREREVLALYTEALAVLIAEETGADADAVEPRVAAAALIGIHRSLIDYVRRRTLQGASAPEIAPEVRLQARRAFARLERGLEEYGVKR
jgi:AcrR family transcriptional regulator